MQFKVQLVVCAENGREETAQDLTILYKDWQRSEHLGLTLAEAKQRLATLQQQLVAWPADLSVTTARPSSRAKGSIRARSARCLGRSRLQSAPVSLLLLAEEFHIYIDHNRAFIPNYGERISTGFVESTINQVISKRFCKRG